MRMALLVAVATFCLMGAAATPSTGAQNTGEDSIPRIIGNRANGFSYQPTPREVVSREKAAGVRPSTTSQQATDQELENIDRRSLLEEGLSTSSVPRFTPR
jgi:hypothetical protein